VQKPITADFSRKTVLVTGASRGIGRAIAVRFADSGAEVAVLYQKNQKAGEETMTLLSGNGHFLFNADISNPTEVQNLVQTVTDKMGSIDILVNNAGIYDFHSLSDVDYQKWQKIWTRTIKTNLIGPANLTFLVARQMIAQGGGKIINISSRSVFRGEPQAPAYGASKAGLNSMSQSLAVALAPHNIYVYVVAPGFVETDMTQSMLNGPEGNDIKNQSPMGRVARPDEVASTILFLATEDANSMTGSIVDINGASYLRS
jgi:NAD(P)-dependent dehydrogenase (short-subunit alcohol dehydrogenase family)